MKTHDLIEALAADVQGRPPLTFYDMGRMAFGCALVLLALVIITLGPRPDWSSAALTTRVLFKAVMAGIGIAAGLSAAYRMMRPDCSLRSAVGPLALLAVVSALGVGAEMMATPAASWGTRLVGQNAIYCLLIVPALALIPFAGLMLVARAGATSHRVGSGAMIGLASGALAAMTYAIHCADDSPFFVVVWYGLAISAVTVLGALTGPRLLKW